MTEEPSPQEQEELLSFVSLSSDGKRIMLNDKPQYALLLPLDLMRKKYKEQYEIVKTLSFNGCSGFRVFYVSGDNLNACAKEIVDQIDERARAAKKDKGRDVVDDERNTKAKDALELAKQHSKELFLNESNRAYAAIRVNDHVEIHPMDERRFKNWISGLYYKEVKDLLSDEDLKKIVRILEAEAEFGDNIPRHRLDVRVRGYNKQLEELASKDSRGEEEMNVDNVGNVGETGGDDDEMTENFDAIYYDLTNPRWEAVKITSEGWEIVKDPPILFRRYGNELAQCYPDPNYPPDLLEQFISLLNVKGDDNKELVKADIVSSFFPNAIPKPILIILALHGSAKTTMFELNTDLIDPKTNKTSSIPKDVRELKQFLAHNFIAYFDNVSHISDEVSDILCRAVTGAHDMKRVLYENDKDINYNYRRKIGLNGITNAATKPDLNDRGLLIELDGIKKSDRKLLRVIIRKYKELKPKLLAFCLDVIVEVMRERQKWRGIDEDYFGMKKLIDQNGGLPRMADWVILAEQIASVIARKENKKIRTRNAAKVIR